MRWVSQVEEVAEQKHGGLEDIEFVLQERRHAKSGVSCAASVPLTSQAFRPRWHIDDRHAVLSVVQSYQPVIL